MARQIFILNVVQTATALDVAGVFWLTPPANLVKPQPGLASAIPTATQVAWGVTAGELTALQNGTVVEQPFDSGQQNPNVTLQQAETFLQNLYAASQAALTAQKNPVAKFVGGYWDGISWTFPP